MDALVGAVYLIYDNNDPVTELKRARQDESRLRHRTLGRVNEQDNAVDHLEYTLDLAAEIGVSRGVDDVYFRIAVLHGGIFRHDGDPALALKVVGVHDSLDYLLIFAVNAALLEHLVDKRGLAVVNVRDDRNISEFLHLNSTPNQNSTQKYILAPRSPNYKTFRGDLRLYRYIFCVSRQQSAEKTVKKTGEQCSPLRYKFKFRPRPQRRKARHTRFPSLSRTGHRQ